MKKLRLDPDTLRIETFAPAAPEAGGGTVVAGSLGATAMSCVSCISCYVTCGATCYQTCNYTCPYTCEPLICA